MPQPPQQGSPRLAPAANPELDETVTLTSIVRSLHEAVSAEQLLAEVRHTEIMAALLHHTGTLQSNLNEQTQHLRQISGTAGQAEDSPTKDTSNPTNAGSRSDAMQKAWSTRVSQVELHAKSKPTQKHLSQDSQFEFGSKYVRQESQTLKGGLSYMSRVIVFWCEKRWFELVISALITCNALVMCFEVQYEGIKIGRKMNYYGIESYDVWPGAKTTFVALDWVFGIVFLLESLLKLMGFRLEYFRHAWNWIDFMCVVAFVVGKISEAFDTASVDARTLRLIRLFRLARLIRLIRTMEKLDMLYIMTTAIKGMHEIVVWAVALLSLMLMTCALFLSEYLQSTYFDDVPANMSEDELKKHKELYKYFGSFSRCMLSMFELTLANWPPVARLLTEEVSQWFGVICVLHKLSIGFAVLGVINGVILQETFKVAHTDDMVMVRQKKLAKKSLTRKMEHLFKALDFDNDKAIGFNEFMIIAAQPEVKLWLESLDIETDDLLTLFLLIDADGNGTLSLEELVEQVPRLRGNARGIDMLAVRKNIPPFQLMHGIDGEQDVYKWSEKCGLSEDKRMLIGGATFNMDSKEAGTFHSLDEILKTRTDDDPIRSRPVTFQAPQLDQQMSYSQSPQPDQQCPIRGRIAFQRSLSEIKTKG